MDTARRNSSFSRLCPYRGNQLVGLPLELEACSKLRDVIVSFNRLREIPPVLYRLDKLENIIASDNQVQRSPA